MEQQTFSGREQFYAAVGDMECLNEVAVITGSILNGKRPFFLSGKLLKS